MARVAWTRRWASYAGRASGGGEAGGGRRAAGREAGEAAGEAGGDEDASTSMLLRAETQGASRRIGAM